VWRYEPGRAATACCLRRARCEKDAVGQRLPRGGKTPPLRRWVLHTGRPAPEDSQTSCGSAAARYVSWRFRVRSRSAIRRRWSPVGCSQRRLVATEPCPRANEERGGGLHGIWVRTCDSPTPRPRPTHLRLRDKDRCQHAGDPRAPHRRILHDGAHQRAGLAGLRNAHAEASVPPESLSSRKDFTPACRSGRRLRRPPKRFSRG